MICRPLDRGLGIAQARLIDFVDGFGYSLRWQIEAPANGLLMEGERFFTINKTPTLVYVRGDIRGV